MPPGTVTCLEWEISFDKKPYISPTDKKTIPHKDSQKNNK